MEPVPPRQARRRPSQREYDDLRISGNIAAAGAERGFSGRSPRKFGRPTADSRHDDPIATQSDDQATSAFAPRPG
jgi:hypothetical protein